jgi:hypothetical protein
MGLEFPGTGTTNNRGSLAAAGTALLPRHGPSPGRARHAVPLQ